MFFLKALIKRMKITNRNKSLILKKNEHNFMVKQKENNCSEIHLTWN